VRGVAVTTLATLEVLERAVDAGANVVVTHEPLYYDHLGAAETELEADADPVYLAKRAFVAEHGLVVWRQHDAWHDRRPDGIDEGTARVLGWTLDADSAAAGEALASIPPTALGELAAYVADTLDARSLRYVGDPELRVTRVGLDLGFRGFSRNRRLLQRPDVDAIVVGEAHEWELGGYVADAATLGGRGATRGKGLIVVGHIPSEQAGMAHYAEWLQDVLPNVRVRFIPTMDVYRRP
jgi:putative NIF3 family GTP cyclohydrolase 1 type 2